MIVWLCLEIQTCFRRQHIVIFAALPGWRAYRPDRFACIYALYIQEPGQLRDTTRCGDKARSAALYGAQPSTSRASDILVHEFASSLSSGARRSISLCSPRWQGTSLGHYCMMWRCVLRAHDSDYVVHQEVHVDRELQT